MAIKCSVFVATSLDGFISRPDGSIDWLDRANALVPPGEDCGFSAFFDSTDTLVMGRNTFEQVLRLGEWPYGSKPVVVMSHREIPLPAQLPVHVKFTRETPQALVTRLSEQGKRHLYVDGGLTVQSFLAERLIDELTITVIPVLLGQGKRLFGGLSSDIRLSHVETHSYDFGFVQLRYRIQRDSGQPAA